MDVSSIRVTGRAAQGVKLIELQKRNDILMSGCLVPKVEEEEVAENAEQQETADNVETNNENQE
jgi:DNA gyrase subunit A